MPAKNPASLRVLIVDDESLIRWSLAETLGRQGWVVTEASDAKSALRLVADAREPFDVVVLDFRLPDSSDLGLLSRIRTVSPLSQVILMTAFGTPELLDHARQLGAVAIVHKPFDLAEVSALAWQVSHERQA